MEIAGINEMLTYIVGNLVEKPEEIQVNVLENGNSITLQLRVAAEDMGRVIGRQGRIAKEIRTLIKAMGLRDDKRVMIFIKRDIPKQKLRQQTSEHPFGTIKHYDDGRYFLCKGKEKVTAEFSLSALAYDIRRAINICGGVQKLIERYRRIAMPKIRKIAEF